jgi:hypothetical protein
VQSFGITRANGSYVIALANRQCYATDIDPASLFAELLEPEGWGDEPQAFLRHFRWSKAQFHALAYPQFLLACLGSPEGCSGPARCPRRASRGGRYPSAV